MFRRQLLLCLASLSLSQAEPVTWAAVKRHPDYRAALTLLADYLPDQAIPKLTSLLASDELTQEARVHLRTRLGEAYLRNGDARAALDHLQHRSPANEDETNFWRGQTLLHLGRLSDAAVAFFTVNKGEYRHQARLTAASLFSALREHDDALKILEMESKRIKANSPESSSLQLQLAATFLEAGKYDEAASALDKVQTAHPSVPYLRGRLALAKKKRQAAIDAFQPLTEPPREERPISRELHLAALMAMADSIALEDRYEEAVTYLLSTLERRTDSEVLTGGFARLHHWHKDADQAALIERLRSWGATPEDPNAALSPRGAHAAHLLGVILTGSDDAGQQEEGVNFLKSVLNLTSTDHAILRAETYRDLGLWQLEKGSLIEASATFSKMAEMAPSHSWKALALELSGKTQTIQKNPKKAAAFFQEAARLGTLPQIIRSHFNAAINLLEVGQLKELEPLLQHDQLRADILLEKGLVLASKQNPAAREALDQFLAENPDHPRRDEATLVLAESAINVSPRDPDLARPLLKGLKFDAANDTDLTARFLLASLALKTRVDEARNFLKRQPDHIQSPEIRFALARYFLSKNQTGDGWGVLEELIDQSPDHPLADTARLMSARAALASTLAGTRERAFKRFDELISAEGPLAIDASIEKAEALNKVGEPAAALKTVRPLLDRKNLAARDHRRLLMLAADAATAQSRYDHALIYYEHLLAISDLPTAWRNKASYFKGRLLEDLDKPKAALATYLKVVNAQLNPEALGETEWKWFWKCGFEGALSLLETEKRWQAAYSLANKLAESGAPEAARAAERASRLRLDHMLYHQ